MHKPMTIYTQIPEPMRQQSMHIKAITLQLLDESHGVTTNRMTAKAGTKELKGGKP